MGKDKVKINVVVIGHVGSRKSTTTGHLIYELGEIDKRDMGIIEKEATEMNKSSFKYAWVLDKLKAKREHGITMELFLWLLETNKYHCILINAPGHPNFNENMIKSALQADCAILIVDPTVGSFEVGTSRNGQIYDHACLLSMLGITQIICCIDKMEATNPDFSKERYDEIRTSICSCLGTNGCFPANIPFVPISGLEGNNLIEGLPNLQWYLEALDQIQVPKRPIDKHLRLPIEYVNKIDQNVTMVAGCVQTGSLKPGTKVIFGPIGHIGKVKSIDIDNKAVQEALAGDDVRCNLKKIDAKDLKPGYVASDSKDDPAKEAIRFKSKIFITANQLGGVIFEGYTPIIDFGSYRGAVKIEKFICKIDPTTGEVDEGSKLLQNGDAAIVEMVPKKPMVVETFGEYAPLGKFVICKNELVVGVGVVESVENKEYPNNEDKRIKSALKEGAKLVVTAVVMGGMHIADILANN
nr:elongation factor 1-alpha-like [Ziziphus jujuba var. spinosa]